MGAESTVLLRDHKLQWHQQEGLSSGFAQTAFERFQEHPEPLKPLRPLESRFFGLAKALHLDGPSAQRGPGMPQALRNLGFGILRICLDRVQF